MMKKGNLYEYIAIYVDDLSIAMKDPKEFIDILEKKHKFMLKGTGQISFHSGMTLPGMKIKLCAFRQPSTLSN
jgi:hypothetical protein